MTAALLPVVIGMPNSYALENQISCVE